MSELSYQHEISQLKAEIITTKSRKYPSYVQNDPQNASKRIKLYTGITQKKSDINHVKITPIKIQVKLLKFSLATQSGGVTGFGYVAFLRRQDCLLNLYVSLVFILIWKGGGAWFFIYKVLIVKSFAMFGVKRDKKLSNSYLLETKSLCDIKRSCAIEAP